MKKIMFNDRYGLTDSVLCGYKTMTRRIDNNPTPKYKIGEILAVAQSYRNVGYKKRFYRDGDKYIFIYKDIHDKISVPVSGWNNKMFTLPVLMPHRIKISNVRREYLQDISDEDCMKEGVYKDTFEHDEDAPEYFYDYRNSKNDEGFATPRQAYASLIDKIGGKGTWESNPLVWVYEFELGKMNQ